YGAFCSPAESHGQRTGTRAGLRSAERAVRGAWRCALLRPLPLNIRPLCVTTTARRATDTRAPAPAAAGSAGCSEAHPPAASPQRVTRAPRSCAERSHVEVDHVAEAAAPGVAHRLPQPARITVGGGRAGQVEVERGADSMSALT